MFSLITYTDSSLAIVEKFIRKIRDDAFKKHYQMKTIMLFE
jgi:hypothetical protein